MHQPGVPEIEAAVPALRRYGRALLRDPQEVDDLVHDCIVRALERMHTRREEGDLRAWMFAIMHNLFVSRVRRLRLRAAPGPLDAVTEAALGRDAGQHAHMDASDTLRALNALPLEQRTVLLLVSVEDLTYAEVARVLDIPIGTVMSRLSRARERLARAMAAPGFDGRDQQAPRTAAAEGRT